MLYFVDQPHPFNILDCVTGLNHMEHPKVMIIVLYMVLWFQQQNFLFF